MRDSEVYLRAARLISDYGGYSCEAVNVAERNSATDAPCRNAYATLFHPDGHKKWGNWGVEWGTHEERRNCRILALLFMAAITESEGR